jgi:hypothetical protein
METLDGRNRIHQFWPTLASFGALFALFTGERIFGGDPGVRKAMAAIAALAVLAALGMRFKELGSATEEKKPVARLLFLTTLLAALGFAVYGSIPQMFSGDEAKTARAVAWTLSPILVICSLAPMAAIELAVYSVAFIERYEHRRVRSAFERGLALGLFLSLAFVGNYLVDRHDTKWDLSYGQKARMSPQTGTAVRDLTEPVKVTLFFAKANEVAEALEPYFDSVRGASSQIEVTRVDQALAAELAKQAGVNENGYVVVSKDKTHEKFRIGEKMSSARSSIRKLDQSFLGALLKVSREKKTAYFTVGHDERSPSPDAKDMRPALKQLKQVLETNQYTVKNLGIAEGLGSEIPNDAAVVFIIGPEKPFSPAEVDTLLKGLDHGARIFIALEAERDGYGLDELLAPLGLKFEKTILGNERTHAVLTRTAADNALIHSNRYSSHESVTTMTRNAKLATIFNKSGALVKLEKAPERTKVEMVLTAVDDTFADLNGNFVFDGDEKKVAYGLAAAITRTSTSGKKSDETRAFVTADADVFADELLLNQGQGNIRLLADIIYWLRAVEEPVVPAISEADVQIVHKKEEDALVFYSTTLGVPVIVLAIGFMMTRGRRRS